MTSAPDSSQTPPPFKTHELLSHESLSHGFFGRQGGVSGGISGAQYASLNAGFGSDDPDSNVEANRARIKTALGAQALLSLNQVHSRDVLIITKPFEDKAAPKADGMVTRVKGLALSALAADCGPVLFADTDAGVIGACHAGWRGALSGITDAVINTMISQGASLENITAVLGPCISQPSYEVGDEFRDSFIAEREIYDQFFTLNVDKMGPKSESETKSGFAKPHFDLKAFILHRLRAAGVSRIAALPDCTYAQPTNYFSYRHNTHNEISGYGRNISAIMLR